MRSALWPSHSIRTIGFVSVSLKVPNFKVEGGMKIDTLVV